MGGFENSINATLTVFMVPDHFEAKIVRGEW